MLMKLNVNLTSSSIQSLSCYPQGLIRTNGIKHLPKFIKRNRSKFPRLLPEFRVYGQEGTRTDNTEQETVARKLPNSTPSFELNYMSPPKGV